MKYLRQEDNRFIFEDGLVAESGNVGRAPFIYHMDVMVWRDLEVQTPSGESVPYKDIQTAVQMMTILKEKGLA